MTGTNGKTTTAALTTHLMRSAGLTVGLGGNIGSHYGPAASLLALMEPVPDWFVVEASSFQLADIERFRPDVGVLTNLAPDHLDRYDSLERYYADKGRLFENGDAGSRWVLPRQREAEALLEGVPGTRFRFGLDRGEGPGAWVDEDVLTLDLGDGPSAILERTELTLLGSHNLENALAALTAAGLTGVGPEPAAEGLRTFEPLPHRLERVVEAKGILWVNDSKATNVAATRSALLSLDRPVVVLLGGTDKGESFRPLRRALKAVARAAVVYGEAAPRIESEIAGATRLRRVTGGFETAVATAFQLSEPGDILLLSPATSSYDMFSGYEARGDAFVQLAQNITGRTRDTGGRAH